MDFIKYSNEEGEYITHPIAGWHEFTTSSISIGDINTDGSIGIVFRGVISLLLGQSRIVWPG